MKRVIREVVYEGPEELVDELVGRSLHGARICGKGRIVARTVGSVPDPTAGARAAECRAQAASYGAQAPGCPTVEQATGYREAAELWMVAAKGWAALTSAEPAPVPEWLDYAVQFPRLLAECAAVLSTKQYEELAESMDLSRVEVDELFNSADAVWESIKRPLPPFDAVSEEGPFEPGVKVYDPPGNGDFLGGSWRPATEEELSRTRKPKKCPGNHPGCDGTCIACSSSEPDCYAEAWDAEPDCLGSVDPKKDAERCPSCARWKEV